LSMRARPLGVAWGGWAGRGEVLYWNLAGLMGVGEVPGLMDRLLALAASMRARLPSLALPVWRARDGHKGSKDLAPAPSRMSSLSMVQL
jgi:hypothetical protein